MIVLVVLVGMMMMMKKAPAIYFLSIFFLYCESTIFVIDFGLYLLHI